MKQQAVPFCCACGKVRDDIHPEPDHDPWMELRSYRVKHGFQSEDLRLVNTYCSDCARMLDKVSHGAGRRA